MKTYSLLILLLLASSVEAAQRLEVGEGRRFARITDALHVALDHDTLLIYPGEYKEGNIIIDKKISLIGQDWPLLHGEGKYEVLSVKSDSVLIRGLHITDSGVSGTVDYAGIKIYDSNAVSIIGNKLTRTFFGIYTQYGKSCVIRDNELSSSGGEELQCGNGIHCWKCDSMQIIHNTVHGHRDGIYFEFVTHSIIWRNTSFSNVRYGLHFMFSNNDQYTGNIFRNNGAGVAVMFSNHVSMFGNYFEENWGDAAYGILLKEISDGIIQGNFFQKNTTGILMEGASRIEMERNTFLSNGWGLKIQASCMDIHLFHNDFISNTFDVATNGSLVLNTFESNYWDKYEGYDLNRDGTGDVPYRPVSLYSMIVEVNPPSMMLFRSFITTVLDKTERVMPSLIPENLVDRKPLMKKVVA